jgi:hypothetical protein
MAFYCCRETAESCVECQFGLDFGGEGGMEGQWSDLHRQLSRLFRLVALGPLWFLP